MRKPTALAIAIVGSLCLAVASARAATITVNSTADTTANDGVCTLREAITAANNNTSSGAMAGECAAGQASPIVDTIAFNISGAGVHTISPASALPSITEAVLIDGYTQPGASPNTLPVGNNAVLLIEIEGSNSGGASSALKIQGPNGGSTIRGLVINRFGFGSDGINVGSSNNTIAGNFIGSDPTGTAIPGASSPLSGIFVSGSSNTIGGTSPAARNLIVVGGTVNGSANVYLDTGGSNLVQGNYLSTNAAGTAPLGLATDGIAASSNGNTIGGTAPGAGNVIVTQRFGIRLYAVNASNTGSNSVIQGNLIGTDATGTTSLGGFSIGISGDGANNTIGGSAAGAGNVISGGGTSISIGTGGGWIIQGNRIGTDITGTMPIPNTSHGFQIQSFDPSASGVNTIGGTNPGEGNTIAFNGGAGVLIQTPAGSLGWGILRNSIFSNGGLGIALLFSTIPTPNDNCDTDTGSNGLQNYPVLTTASSTGGSTNIQGTLNSVANTTYRIEFFSNNSCDPAGNGEGQTYLGFTNVTTDSSCNASFNVTLPVSVSPQSRLTATATDPGNNSSEFSACTSLQARYHTVTPCRVADTRGATGAYGGPALAANADRTFVIGGQCGISATAQAVSFNFTVTLPTALGDLRTFPGGGTLPLVSTMNWRPGQTRANNAIVPLGSSGDLVVHVDQGSGTVHFIIDVNGYFE